jgi:hypothetical protein
MTIKRERRVFPTRYLYPISYRSEGVVVHAEVDVTKFVGVEGVGAVKTGVVWHYVLTELGVSPAEVVACLPIFPAREEF